MKHFRSPERYRDFTAAKCQLQANQHVTYKQVQQAWQCTVNQALQRAMIHARAALQCRRRVTAATMPGSMQREFFAVDTPNAHSTHSLYSVTATCTHWGVSTSPFEGVHVLAPLLWAMFFAAVTYSSLKLDLADTSSSTGEYLYLSVNPQHSVSIASIEHRSEA
jgi:hypothetical protein